MAAQDNNPVLQDPWGSFVIRIPSQWTELMNGRNVHPNQNQDGEGIAEAIVVDDPSEARCEQCEAVSAELQVLKADYATLKSRTAAEIDALKAEVNALKAKNTSLELESRKRSLEALVGTGAEIEASNDDGRVADQDLSMIDQEGENGEGGQAAEVQLGAETVTNCAKEANHEDDLKNDQKIEVQTLDVSEPQPPVICSVCGMVLPTKGNLVTHMFFHSGVRPFACDICEARFVFIRNLLEHRREHGPRPYICRECGKQFGFKKSLKAHQDRDVRCKGRVSQGSRDQEESNMPMEQDNATQLEQSQSN